MASAKALSPAAVTAGGSIAGLQRRVPAQVGVRRGGEVPDPRAAFTLPPVVVPEADSPDPGGPAAAGHLAGRAAEDGIRRVDRDHLAAELRPDRCYESGQQPRASNRLPGFHPAGHATASPATAAGTGD